MSDKVAEAARMLDMLPEAEQSLACELIKRLVRAWDPDFTKTTPEEAARLRHAEQSGFVDESEIDWAHLSEQF